MFNEYNELIFPPSAIESLTDLRGDAWRSLIEEVQNADHQSTERLAFILMMSKLNGCASCNSDSYRALQGCALCSKQFLQRYRGTDGELLELYRSAKDDIEKHCRGTYR